MATLHRGWLASGDFNHSPHRRWNPLRREWVVVSPHRTQRPWLGQKEEVAKPAQVQFDPACYLCPGNARTDGRRTPQYDGVYIFENDFAALNSAGPSANVDVGSAGLLRAETERGVCRVICFSPRHDLTLATMPVERITDVVNAWVEQERELAERPEIQYVQIFENRGTMMGASNPHPHGQVWATEHLPNEPALELAAQHEYLNQRGKNLLIEYLALELMLGERVVTANNSWVALVPFWAVWPFELLLLPRRAVSTLCDLGPGEREDLAAILHTVTGGYDRVFDAPFPYSMGFHPAPCDGKPHPEWQLHAHFFPPLLRSATVRKFMVGFELLGSPQRDITPEAAATMLRNAFLSEPNTAAVRR